MAQVFICYRRATTRWVARNLKNNLERHFGEQAVFLDSDNLDAGLDFRDRLMEAVSGCKVLLALISDTWLSASDAKGRKLEDDDDFVRIEIESALQRNIPVIPVLVDGAQMPIEDELPLSIKPLAFRQAAKLRADDWDQDFARLIKALESKIKPQKVAAAGNESVAKAAKKKHIAAGLSESKPTIRKPTETSQRTPAGKDLVELARKKYEEQLAAILRGLQGLTDSRVYLDSSIPKFKLDKAIKAYAPAVAPKDVILLFDGTVFSGGDKGLLLTTQRIYWRNAVGETGSIAYQEIKTTTVRESNSIFAPAEVLVNKLAIPVAAGDDWNKLAAALARAIKNLVKYEKQQQKQ